MSHRATLTHEEVVGHREAAAEFIAHLIEAALRVVPDRAWTANDLREVLDFAQGADEPVFLEGHAFQKRLREEIDRADRYRQPFAVVVASIGGEHRDAIYASVIDTLREKLRRTDMVFLYARRVAVLLPHTPADAVAHLLERLGALFGHALGHGTDVAFASAPYPSRDLAQGPALEAWVEERLRA